MVSKPSKPSGKEFKSKKMVQYFETENIKVDQDSLVHGIIKAPAI